MAGLEPYKHGYYLWKYVPSLAAAAIFSFIFGLITIAYVWRVWKFRSWFCIPFAIGCYMEFLGYACRAAAHNATGKLMPYVMQNNNILLAPLFFAATVYMALGRLITAINGEAYSVVPLKWLTRLFVCGDVLTLAVQASGAGIMIVSSLAKTGQAIAIVGLLAQIIIFGFFCITTVLFHRRMARGGNWSGKEVLLASGGQQGLQALYGISACIMGRSIFRTAEFIDGASGYLFSVEWPLYIFDTLPMLCVVGLFWWTWPVFVGGSPGIRPIPLQFVTSEPLGRRSMSTWNR